MAIFKDQIEDLAGTIPATCDAEQFLKDAVLDIISKIKKINPLELSLFATSEEINGGLEVSNIEILDVSRDDKNCRAIQSKNRHSAEDTDSFHYAGSDDPVYYILNKFLHVLPTGGSPTASIVADGVVTDWDTGTSSITNFPSDKYNLAILYAAYNVLHCRMLDSTTPTVVPTLSITSVSPDIPTIASIAYTGPSTSDVGSAPTVLTTAYVLPSASTAFSSRLADFSALTSFSITSVAPDEIPVPAISSPGVSDVTLADITGSIPSYSTVTVDSGTLGALASLTISDLTILSVPPDAFTPQEVTYTPPSAAIAVAPSGIDDIIDIDDADVSSITAASSGQPTYSPPSVVSFPTSAINTALAALNDLIDDEEDTELASSKGQEISMLIQDFQAELSKYQAELGDASTELNKDSTVYQVLVQQATQNANATNSHAVQNMQKELQRAQSIVQTGSTEHATALQIVQANAANLQAKIMQDAIQTVQVIIADNNSKMQEWSQGLAHYQAEVNTEVQEYTNNLQKATQLWQQTNMTRLQDHSQRMQDSLNIFNKENAQYQANVQVRIAKFQADVADATKEADLTIQAQIQDYTFELQKWQQSLGQYQAKVNTEVQEFTQKLQMEIQSWTAEQANAIQQYQMETADNMKTADIANQAALQQGQSDLQVAVRDKDKQLEREIQNATNEMQEIIQNNQSLLAKYQAEASVYQAEVQEEVQENTQNLQKFQADLQAKTVDYQWLQDQYARLKGEYMQAFSIAQPQA